MILGILSDTHGRIAIARAAIDRLKWVGCEHFIHCGDLGDGIVGLLPAGRSTFVFGNCDFDLSSLRSEADAFGVRCLASGGVIGLGGIGVAVTHGDDSRQVSELLAGPSVRYLFTGHTHVAHDRREGRVRWINPGALQRSTRKSVATLDLVSDQLTFHDIAPV